MVCMWQGWFTNDKSHRTEFTSLMCGTTSDVEDQPLILMIQLTDLIVSLS